MAHRRSGSGQPNGEHDPFREYLSRAMDELLKFAERSDRRWKDMERRWEEDRRLRAEQYQTFIDAIERNNAAYDKIMKSIDETNRTNVAALEGVIKSLDRVNRTSEGSTKITLSALGSVADALHEFSRELRRRRGPGRNGGGNGRR